MRYEVVFVDWDGTLSGSRFWEHWATDSALSEANEMIQKHLFQASPELITEWMRGHWSAEDIVDVVSKRTRLRVDDLLTGLRESCERMKLFDDTVLNIVSELRQQGSKVVIATNNMDTFSRWTVPSLGLSSHFDAVLNSHSLKALKSDRRGNGRSKFSSTFLDAHGVHPSRTILIDDSTQLSIVQDFGINYAQVTPQRSALSLLSSL